MFPTRSPIIYYLLVLSLSDNYVCISRSSKNRTRRRGRIRSRSRNRSKESEAGTETGAGVGVGAVLGTQVGVGVGVRAGCNFQLVWWSDEPIILSMVIYSGQLFNVFVGDFHI